MRKYLRIYRNLYNTCKKSGTYFSSVVYREMIYRLFHNKKFWVHQNVKINGVKNIDINGRLTVGLSYVGFIHKSDKTLLNVKGKLRFSGDYSIGRGCRFDIGTNAIVSFGKGGYITANTTFIIMHKLIIGDNCAISWDCQFLDDDLHEIRYDGMR